MSHATFLIIAVSVVVDGAASHGTRVGATLAGLSGWRDVFAVAENLHLSQLQHLFRTWKLHANNSGQRSRFQIRRHDFSFEAGEHKIAKPGLRGCFEPDSTQFIARERQFDRVARGVLALCNQDSTIAFDLRIAFTHFGWLRTLPAQITRKTAIPGFETCEPLCIRLSEFRFQCSDLGFERLTQFFQVWRFKGMIRSFVLFVRIGALIEEGVELKVFIDRERIVFVRVALRTGHGGAHPHGKGGIHSINHRCIAEFFIIRATFVLCHRIAVKGGSDELIIGWIWQQVTRELLYGELIKAHV